MSLGLGPAGYSDMQRIANFDGPQLVTFAPVKVKESLLSAVVNVSRYASILLVGTTGLESTAVKITWGLNEATGTGMGSRTIILSPSITGVLYARLANLGPWMRVELSAPAEYTGTYALYASNRTPPPEIVPSVPVALSLAETALKASESKTLYPAAYASGPAELTYSITGAEQAAKYQIETETAPGTWVITSTTAVLSAGSAKVTLPTGAWRLTIVNAAKESKVTAAITPSPTGSA